MTARKLVDHIFSVSTHSRLKAAGFSLRFTRLYRLVSTHSRLKAAGGVGLYVYPLVNVSTHSRLKAAGPSSPSA